MRTRFFKAPILLISGLAALSLTACGKSEDAASQTAADVDAPAADMSLDASTSDALIDQIAGATDPAQAEATLPAPDTAAATAVAPDAETSGALPAAPTQ